MHKLNIGIIGLGEISHSFHIPAIQKIQTLNLVAVCDLSQDALDEIECSNKFKNFKIMIKEINLDIIIIATPHKFHCEQATYALNHNIHVAIEKPLTLTKKDALKIKNASMRNNKKVICLHHSRFRPQSLVLKSKISEIGEIYYAKSKAIFRRGIPKQNHFRDLNSRGGGPIYDIGAHNIDLAWWLMGRPKVKKIKAYGWNKLCNTSKISIDNELIDTNNYFSEEFAIAYIEFEDNKVLSVEIGYLINCNEDIEVKSEFFGTGGSAIWPECTIIDNDKNISKLDYDDSLASINQLNHFVDIITSNSKPIITIDDNIVIVSILEKIIKQLRIS